MYGGSQKFPGHKNIYGMVAWKLLTKPVHMCLAQILCLSISTHENTRTAALTFRIWEHRDRRSFFVAPNTEWRCTYNTK